MLGAASGIYQLSHREQERREERQRARADAGGALDALDEEGSFDDGDPYTTNLYIGMCHTLADAVLANVLNSKVMGRSQRHKPLCA